MLYGGYFMIDATGLDLTKGSTPQTITGIYSRCKAAMITGKPVYAFNTKWGTISASPIPVMLVQLESDTITATSATLQIVIKDTDVVTINNLVA